MNVKRLSKRSLSVLLSVLLLLSTLVVGTVTTANAEGTWSFTATNNTTATSQHIYAYFDKSSAETKGWTSSKTAMVIMTSESTSEGVKTFFYTSSAFSQGVSNTAIEGNKYAQLLYNDVWSTFNTLSLNWSNVTGLFFAELNYNNEFSKKHTDSTDFAAFCTNHVNGSRYTSRYTSSLSITNCDRFIVVPSSSNLSINQLAGTTASNYSVMNFTQSVTADNGTASITKYYDLTGTSTTTERKDVSLTSANAAYLTEVTVSASGTGNFLGWYNGDTKVSTTPTYSYVVRGANSLVAKFDTSVATQYTQDIKVYTGETESSDGGTVTVSIGDEVQTYPYEFTSGTSVTLTATPNTGYLFDGYYDGETLLSSQDTYTYTVDGAKTVKAKFSLDTTKFNFYSEGSAATKTSKIFFVRSGNWALNEDTKNKVFILLYADVQEEDSTVKKVYSVQLGQVKNSCLNAASTNSIVSNLDITWPQVTDIAFIQLTNEGVASGLKNADLTESLGVADITPAKAEENKIAYYTAKYSSPVSDRGNVKYHYFTPGAANGEAVTLESKDEPANFAQSVEVKHYGGYVTVTAFEASNTNVNQADNIPKAIYAEPGKPVEFNAAYTSTVTLTPTPNDSNNYKFEGWYSDADCTKKISGSGIDENGTYTYTAESAKTLYVKFSYKGSGTEPRIYSQNVTDDGHGAVAAIIEGSTQTLPYIAAAGVSVTLVAYPNTGYRFDGFYDGETKLDGSSNPYTYTISGITSLTAKFIADNSSLAQTASVPGGGGTATVSSASVTAGASVTFTAVADTGYTFYGWYTKEACTGKPLSTEAEYTFIANTANTLYAKFDYTGNDSSLVTNSVKNTGDRHENAVLSQQAKDYYQNDAMGVSSYKNAPGGVYETFVNLSDAETNDSSDSYAVAQDNSLYTALYEIMSTTHTHAVSYPAYDKNSLANYWLTTDTSSKNKNDGREVYTFFYSDVNDYNHKDMQREHIWPKSKASFLMKTGLGGSDLHHLRPAYGRVNLIKSNWGFASIKTETDESYTINAGWKNPYTVDWPAEGTDKKVSLWRAIKVKDDKEETFIDVADDVRGDVARILLYVYTRWQQPNLYSDIVDSDGNPDTSRLPELDPDDNKDTGERIIYDLNTLLDWMKNDPVSEWEMQRNDLTQNIQGNRNVFIDYPELAWLMFDQKESMPSNMATPSGMAAKAGNYNADLVKEVETPTYGDKITLDFSEIDGNGAAEITAYDNTIGRQLKDGDTIDRGDVITYTIAPDESKLSKIREYKTDANSGSGKVNEIVTFTPETDSSYTFTRLAGYYDGAPNIEYKKERIMASLVSDVVEVIYAAKSKTATGNAGGSGSGMVLAQYASDVGSHAKGDLIQSGDTVPNGTEIVFTATPDYGSYFYSFSSTNGLSFSTPTALPNTNNTSYRTKVTMSSQTSKTDSKGKTTITYSSRTKNISIYFAQTFNALDYVRTSLGHGMVTDGSGNEVALDWKGKKATKHVNNKGMRPDATDEWGDKTDFTTNFEICGVQVKDVKGDEGDKALRFISVIDRDILERAESYGYVIGLIDKVNLGALGSKDGGLNADVTKTINRNAYSLVKDGTYGVTVDCTNSDNTYFGEYGKANSDKNYKYVTAAIHNIQASGDLDTVIVARPYVVLKDEYRSTNAPEVIYGQYIDFSTGEAFCACSGSFNYINGLRNENPNDKKYGEYGDDV